MKWYQEINQSGTSFEAKGIYMHSKHSIEFNKSGHIEDVEIEVERKQLPIKTLASIENYLSRKYEAFKLKKIKQWTAKQSPKASIKRANILIFSLAMNALPLLSQMENIDPMSFYLVQVVTINPLKH